MAPPEGPVLELASVRSSLCNSVFSVVKGFDFVGREIKMVIKLTGSSFRQSERRLHFAGTSEVKKRTSAVASRNRWLPRKSCFVSLEHSAKINEDSSEPPEAVPKPSRLEGRVLPKA